MVTATAVTDAASAASASVVVVVVVSVVVVVVSVAVVVVEEPPQAASDNAMSEMPPALAAFLAFLDSQAFTSLLVAFTMQAKNKLMNTKENMLAVKGS